MSDKPSQTTIVSVRSKYDVTVTLVWTNLTKCSKQWRLIAFLDIQDLKMFNSCVRCLQRSVPFISLEAGDGDVDDNPGYTNWWIDHSQQYEMYSGKVSLLFSSHSPSAHQCRAVQSMLVLKPQ